MKAMKRLKTQLNSLPAQMVLSFIQAIFDGFEVMC